MTNLRRSLLAIALLLSTHSALALSDLALSSLYQKGKHHELIEVLEPAVVEDREVTSMRLLLLAGSYWEVGKYRQASETADRLDRRIAAGDASVFGADLRVYPAIIRGQVALDEGLYDEAVRIASAAQLKPDQAFYRQQLIQLNGILGVAHALLGHAEEARRSLARIREVNLFLTNLGPEKYTTMARIQLALGDFSGALESIDNREANVSPVLTMFYDPTFHNLPRFFMRAKALYETGRAADARLAYDELLAHPQIGQYGSMLWLVLYDRARIAVAEGDLAGATQLLERAAAVIEQRRSSIADEAARIGFVGDKQTVYALLVDVLVRQGRGDDAFLVVERAKARALVDLLASKNDFAMPGADAGQIRTALAEIETLERASVEKPARADDAPALRNLAVSQQKLAQTAPALANLVGVGSASLADIASGLAPDEALVEYFFSGADAYAFVLRSDGQAQVARLTAPSLEQDVQALRAAIERADGNDWQAPAARLDTQLLQPIRDWLGTSRRLLIVAHGALHYLPFAALRGPDGSLLLDRYGLRFLPSASVLKFLAPAPAGTRASLLALGNPDLGDAALDLKFAAEEARAVAKTYADARLLLRQDASETNFRKAAGAFRRVHIASHGRFSADAPLNSGLYLAKDAENDGLLTVGELYSMELKADLVTLSACETGLGKVANGDDVVGLNRGFLYAGARSIVASLWSVDDKATEQLMTAFYRALAGGDKVEALRRAQLAVRRSFPHPFFWAAFQLTGRAD